MKQSRFTEGQIAYALRQVDGGTALADVYRQMAPVRRLSTTSSASLANLSRARTRIARAENMVRRLGRRSRIGVALPVSYSLEPKSLLKAELKIPVLRS